MLVNMKIARIKKGVSQVNLSEITGLSTTTISKLEQGKYTVDNVSFGTLKKISKALDISIDELTASNNTYAEE